AMSALWPRAAVRRRSSVRTGPQPALARSWLTSAVTSSSSRSTWLVARVGDGVGRDGAEVAGGRVVAAAAGLVVVGVVGWAAVAAGELAAGLPGRPGVAGAVAGVLDAAPLSSAVPTSVGTGLSN